MYALDSLGYEGVEHLEVRHQPHRGGDQPKLHGAPHVKQLEVDPGHRVSVDAPPTVPTLSGISNLPTSPPSAPRLHVDRGL